MRSIENKVHPYLFSIPENMKQLLSQCVSERNRFEEKGNSRLYFIYNILYRGYLYMYNLMYVNVIIGTQS